MASVKIAENTTLKEILEIPEVEEILLKYRIPCLSCPMASFEIENLRIGDVCGVYGIDTEKLLKEINDYLKDKTIKPKINDQSKSLEQKLEEWHPIHTMVSEHEMILSFLDELDGINKKIQKPKGKIEKSEIEKLKDIAHHLIEAEPHYQREEEVLFPEVEKRGIFGPPEVMRQEHKELREYKKKIKKLAGKGIKMETRVFKEKVNESCDFILRVLREHIFKENNILYPMALEIIKEEEVWQKIKTECDKIGYCCFTPKN